MADLISQIKGLDNVTYDLQDKISTFGNENILPSEVITNENIEGSTKEFSLTPAQLRTHFGNGKFFWNNFEENTQYTFSVSAKPDDPTSYDSTKQGALFYLSYVDGSTSEIMRFYHGETDFIRKSITSMPNKTVNKLFGSYGNSSCTWTYQDLKLEKGNKPTDWTPSCYDLAIYNDNDETITFFQ